MQTEKNRDQRFSTLGFDAVLHLVLFRIENRPRFPYESQMEIVVCKAKQNCAILKIRSLVIGHLGNT